MTTDNYVKQPSPDVIESNFQSTGHEDVQQAMEIEGVAQNIFGGIDRPSVPLTSDDKSLLQTQAERLSSISTGKLSRIGNVNQEHEFTWRSVILGTIIGCIMAAQNVYFGLRNGQSFGNGVVASLIGYAAMKSILKCFRNAKKFNLQEHVILQTAATANISTIFTGGFSQYILAMSPEVQRATKLGEVYETWNPSYLKCVLWLFTASFIGFFLAQPFRKKLIVEQNLPWPTPTATAVVCAALHSEDKEETSKMIPKIGYATFFSFVWQWVKWIFDGKNQMEKWPIFGLEAAKYTWTIDWSTAFVGGGMLLGRNVAYSMALGGLYGYGFIFPYATSMKGIWYPNEPGIMTSMKGPKGYWFFTSLGVVVMEGIYQALKILFISVNNFRLQRRNALDQSTIPKDPELSSRLISSKTWMIGLLVNVIIAIVIISTVFKVKWYLIIIVFIYAVPVGYGICFSGALIDTFYLSIIAKLTIMLFGSSEGDLVSVLWLSGIGLITVGSCELLLQDYRVGQLTGTSPKAMFKSQCIAAIVGCIATPASYKLFLNSFEITSNGKFTAPGAVGLRALAVVFRDGWSALPLHSDRFIIATVIVCLINSIAKDLLPNKYSKYLPNSMAFGIGFYTTASFAINALLGNIIITIWTYYRPASAKRYCAVVAGGMIAGEGLGAIGQAIFNLVGINKPKSLGISFG